MSMSPLCGRLAYFYSVPRPGRQKLGHLGAYMHIFWLLCAFLARLGSSPGHPGLGGQISCFDGLSQTRGFAIQFPIKLFNLEPPGSKCSSEGFGPLSR